MKTFAETLKYYRTINGCTQSELADKTGISQQRISYYERGARVPSLDDCVKLADVFGISLDELAGREYGKAND
ncbi:MAG TPA: helix-turn-helix domain-containing protein [Firmicutes bacterium]|nr:helix-turn-helix domain-containing protein [Bacillota bacterium]